MTITQRAFVRIISFSVAVIAVLGYLAWQNGQDARRFEQGLQNNYLRAIEDLSTSVDNIKNTLSKGMYASSPEMLQGLTNKLWDQANAAKNSLSVLPVTELQLENTYKFLSQVGDYAVSLAEKVARGEALTEEEQQNLVKLKEYAETLSADMWELEGQLAGGLLTFEKTKKIVQQQDESVPQASFEDGFKEFEESFTDYPTLIYDGPFSDHILQQEPLMLKGLQGVDRATARKKALAVTGLETIGDDADESGKMPSYVFKDDGVSVSVTKAGGLLSYMIKSREVLESNLSVEEAIEIAQGFLSKLGVGELTHTYYEILDNTITINFAGMQEEVTLYTDLIKVCVALDNGEVVGCDARGYLVNHQKREIAAPKLGEEEASAKVSKILAIREVKLCMIPTEGKNEVYCYEFSCVNQADESGQQVLVYINADTGYEEQILILLISESGVLTM